MLKYSSKQKITFLAAAGLALLAVILLTIFILHHKTLKAVAISSRSYHIIDSHLHFVDFLQNSDGISQLLREMDKNNVTNAVIFGLSLTKKWSASERLQPHYYLDDDSEVYLDSFTDATLSIAIQQLPAEQQKRFYPLICGFDPTDLNAVNHIKKLVAFYPNFWRGIGEVLLHHDVLTALSKAEIPHTDAPAMMRIYALAAQCKVPILLHSNITSIWRHEPIYLHELEAALAGNPNTTIVWAHAGISRNISINELIPTVERMLSKYNNLYVDLSWVVYEQEVLDTKGKPKEGWIKLIEKFPDRFMIGTDLIGDFSRYGETITKYYKLLDRLTPETAKKVAVLTATKVFSNTMTSACVQ